MVGWTLTRTFGTEQGEIAWDVLGDGGAPVVLIHGTPFSSYIWREVAPALAQHFRVFVWDLAGYGASAKHYGQDVSLAAQGRILAALLDHWGLDRPHLVGHDFGGTVALRALLLEGRRADRLVLADAVAVAPWGTGFFRLVKEHADVLAQLPDPVHDGMVRGYVSWPSYRPLDLGTIDALAAPWCGAQGRAALYRQIIQNDQHLTDEIQHRYGEIDVPTLILWGEEDNWLPPEQAHQLHGLIPGSKLRLLPGAGHLVQFDAPATLTIELAAFLGLDGG